jgi:L-rhamnose-H+ transport protein
VSGENESIVGLGVLLVLVAGVMVGNCMTPLQQIRSWKWENAWLVFSLVSLVIIPVTLALLSIPQLWSVYHHTSWRDLLLPFIFGAGWGVAQVLFGIAVVRLGMALAFAIVVGLGAMLGTLVPVLIQRMDVLVSRRGILLLCGTFLMLTGVIVCRHAGELRDRVRKATTSARESSEYRTGLLIAVTSGLLSGLLNFALAFGEGITHAAIAAGASVTGAPYAVWPVALAGGLIPNLWYSIHLLNRNTTWLLFQYWWPDLGWAALMGLLWMGAVAIYGVSTRYLGAMGTSAGWALYEIFMILTASVSGIVSGEWRGAGRPSITALGMGLLLLIVATFLLARSNV